AGQESPTFVALAPRVEEALRKADAIWRALLLRALEHWSDAGQPEFGEHAREDDFMLSARSQLAVDDFEHPELSLELCVAERKDEWDGELGMPRRQVGQVLDLFLA